jgi:O-antigen ligase
MLQSKTMNHPLTIKDSLANKVTYFHLLAFLVSLPFDRFYSQLVFISLVLHTLITLEKKQLKQVLRKEVIILQSVFLLTVICTAWSVYRNNAFGAWEKQSAIFLFPLLFVLTDLDLNQYKNKLLAAFAYTCTALIFYLYVDAFRIISYYHFPLRKLFTPFFLNHNFSKPIGLHATYLSLYIALSIIALLMLIVNRKHHRASILLHTFCLLVLSAGLLQLASRAVLIAFLIIVNAVLPWYVATRKGKIRFLLLSVLVSALVLFCIFRTDSLNFRLVQGLRDDVSATSLPYSAADPRAKRWELAMSLVKQSPVVGFGTGAEIPMLKEAYFENKFYDSYLNELNAHNQYLSFLLKGGLFALAIYLFTLFYCFRIAIRKRDPVFIGFLVLVAVTGLSENILDVNKGIFFFAFFLSLFACAHLKKSAKPPDHKKAGNQRMASYVFLYNTEVKKPDPWL